MPDRNNEKYIVAVTEDLFFSSKIRQAAGASGITADFIKATDGLIDKLTSHTPSLLIVDLSSKKLDALGLIREIKAAPLLKKIPVLGYLPHVETELRDRAAQAGCDIVLPRSRFSKEMREILARFTTR